MIYFDRFWGQSYPQKLIINKFRSYFYIIKLMYSHSVSNEAVIGKNSTDKKVSVFCRNLIS